MIAINNRTQPAFEGALKQARPDEIAGEVRDQAQQIINAADNAGDATRAVDNAGDAAKATDNAGDAAKATDNADEASMRTPDDADQGGGGGNNGGGTSGPVNRAVPQDVADELVSSGKLDEIEDALGISDEVATASREAVELTDEIAETADDAVGRVRNHNPTTGHTEGWGGFDITVSEMWKTKRNFTSGDRQMMQDLKTAYTGLGDLNPATWATLSVRERKRAIQQSITSTMEAMGIPKSRWPKVTLTSLPPGQYGWADWSPLSKRGELCINIDNAVGDVVGTVAHESRHYFQMWQAYQHQVLGRALDRLHPHTGEWMPNLPSFGGTYHSGGKAYFTQPIEADAETFGRRVIDLLPARWPKSAAQQAGNAGGATKAAGNTGGAARAVENGGDATRVTRNVEEEAYLSHAGGAGYVNEINADPGAIEAYKKIAAMEGDAAKIAANYGLPEDVVSFVKHHFFIKEHRVASGPNEWETGKFTPYDDWAKLWNEGIEGVHDPEEIRNFLTHEYVEGKLMEAGFSYNSADPEYWARFGGYPSPTSQSFGAHDLSYSPRGFKHWLGIFADRPEMLKVAEDLMKNPVAPDLSNLDQLVGIILGGVPKP